MKTRIILILALAVAVSAVFRPVANHDFISLDDPRYIIDNPHIRDGLSVDGLSWAFTSIG